MRSCSCPAAETCVRVTTPPTCMWNRDERKGGRVGKPHSTSFQVTHRRTVANPRLPPCRGGRGDAGSLALVSGFDLLAQKSAGKPQQLWSASRFGSGSEGTTCCSASCPRAPGSRAAQLSSAAGCPRGSTGVPGVTGVCAAPTAAPQHLGSGSVCSGAGWPLQDKKQQPSARSPAKQRLTSSRTRTRTHAPSVKR